MSSASSMQGLVAKALMLAFLNIYFIGSTAEALNTQSIDFEAESNQYLSITDLSQTGLDGSTNMTVEAWVKFESLPTNQNATIISKSISVGDNRSYTFYYSGPDPTTRLRWVNQSDGNNGTDVGVAWTPSTGVWYHLAVSKLGTNVTFYVNGTQQGATQTGTSAINNSTAPVRIGSHGNNESYFDGLIDDVRVWNVARTQAQIDADFKTELTGTEPNLAAYWTFNGGSLEDLTANNNDFASPHGFTSSADIPFDDAPPPPPAEPDPVIIIPGILGSEQVGGVWKIDPILHSYDDLFATLDVNHYTPEVDLFTFPYNWRESNVDTALLLKQKIDEVKGICACDKVDLVAHSMGGLVARQYIQSDDYEDDVDQLIFLGTPHLGAPKAYLMWEGGEADFTGIFGLLFKSLLWHEAKENGYQNGFSYIQGDPIESVRELLPTYDYLSAGGTLSNYPTGYPTNPFLDNLNGALTDLLSAGIDIHNIIGETASASTITEISTVNPAAYLPLWPHGYPDGFYEKIGNRGLERGSGDDTVPLPSASFVSENLVVTPHSHAALPVATEGDVYQILTGEVAGFLSTKYDSTTEKLLHIKIYSPADLLVIAPDGKKIGAENGLSINEIPDAFYTGSDAVTEFITVLNPVDGDYVIQIQGVGSAPYTVEVSYLTNENVIDASFTGNTTPGLVTELSVSLDNENPENLDIQPEDTGAPSITINAPEVRDYLRSEQLPIDVSATDDSGVFSLVTLFDDLAVSIPSFVDLFYQSLGIHTLTTVATDNVGNTATSTRSVSVIATLESMLSDVERAFGLGWMAQAVHDKLIDKLHTAIEKRDKGQSYEKFLSKHIADELEKRRGGTLNEQAYQLLKEDTQWLISN